MGDTIIELAARLGRSIQESSQAASLREARKELDQHKDVLDLLKEYQDQLEKVQKLEDENKPVEVSDKHRLQEIQGKLISNDVFKKYTAAQVEYVDLMRQVNTALHRQLAETEKE